MPMRKANLLRLLPLASLVLAACTINTPKGPATSPTSPQWREHEAQVKKLEHYQTRGSFAYISDKQKVYARFFWQQYSPDSYRLLLTNPLGSTEMELKVQSGIAQVTNNQGKKYTSDNPDEMIQKLTGMSIPLANLRLWMLGLPGDESDFTLDSQYRLSKVNYSHNGLKGNVVYQSYSNDMIPSLPDRLELTQDDQRIKLKMDSWTLN
ncbi:lipoprotein insertase outer membrane protein LolB [Ewingella americana]|uniref:Outer-membrane lipoprotein LolB n=1 Tax=Ewingella americana TaxID=41202 RepID=A0A502G0Y6_9GAMM|nr:lipoprotein insertase outer membrane protein LolB [Ewingella americana]TPG55439.1 lipoprotein localization protein LolB [Ewingella americana]